MSMLLLMEDSFLPYDLFRASEQGIWLDSTDFSTMFQDDAGTTPVTALGQSVGLVLDKSKGLVLGPERRQDFVIGLIGTAQPATYNPATGQGSSSRVDASNVSFIELAGLPANKFFLIRLTNTGLNNLNVRQQGGGTIVSTLTAGQTLTTVVSTATFNDIRIQCAVNSASTTFTLLSARELPGNHAYQTTAASRPTVQARVNLLTYSEQFDNAAWVKAVGGTGVAPVVTQNYAAAPDGTMTAARVQLNKGAGTTNSDLSILQQSVTYLAGAHTNRIYVKANGAGEVGKKVLHRGAASGAYTTTTLDGTWQEITWTETAAGGAISTIAVGLRGAQGLNADSVDVLVWHPQVEFGPTATTYQRVTTATDYADVGAPRYLQFDKTDDHLLVAAGGAGTTGFLLACGVVVPAAGTARTIFSDRGTNAGYRLSIDTANKLVFSGGTGAAFTTLTSAAALTTGQKYAVIAWHDGTNLNLSINNVAETPVACGTVTAGTATFTIGKDNGAASGYWGDRLYSMVYRKNDTSNAGNRSNLFSYLVGKMGGL